MSLQSIKRALISVSDKENLVTFTQALEEYSIEMLATGGTYTTLEQAGIKARRLDEVVRYPEMIDGRVKTLQPEIFAGILARHVDDHLHQLREMEVEPIDMVVCNFYPFEKTVSEQNPKLEDLIEHIDIGGPSLVRAAAKNNEYVTVVPSPKFYDAVVEELQSNEGSTSLELRRRLAQAAFGIVSSYDMAIYSGLRRFTEPNQIFPDHLFISAHKFEDAKYGENPNQKAAVYKLDGYSGMADWPQIYGEQKSFNNHLDVGEAYQILDNFLDNPAAATVKHGHISGFAFAPTLAEAYTFAHECDPEADFGGTAVFNREVDAETAKLVGKNSDVVDSSVYTEIVIAPGYSPDALNILKAKQKRKMRIIYGKGRSDYPYDIKMHEGLLLVQETPHELKRLDTNSLTYPTKTKVDDETLAKLLAAWNIVRKVRSNGIVIGDGKISGGTLNYFWTLGVASFRKRNGATKISLENAGERARGAVAASDGFFPFRDSVDLLGKAGVQAIIQPGGSISDAAVVKAADDYGVAMVFTHTRTFKH